MRSQGYKSMEDSTAINMDEITFIVVGKTGNGKSFAANLILGRKVFQESTSMASETTRMSQAEIKVNGKQIKVIDTPDPVNLELSEAGICAEVARWKSEVVGKFAIVLAVRCDVRYTAEEYDIYKKIKRAWGDNKSFTDHLVVAFTFGDRQDRDIHDELRTVCWELSSVLADAGKRYVLFKNQNQEAAHDNESEKQKLISYATTVVPRPSTQTINQPLLLLSVFFFIIVITAVWFGVPWESYVLKTPVFLVVIVVIIVGVIAFGYRRRIFPCINFAMLININIFPFIFALIFTPLKVFIYIGK